MRGPTDRTGEAGDRCDYGGVQPGARIRPSNARLQLSSHQWFSSVFADTACSPCQAGLFYSYGQGVPCPPLLGSDIWSYHPHRCWPHCAYPCTRSQAFVPSSSFCHSGLTHHHLAPGPNPAPQAHPHSQHASSQGKNLPLASLQIILTPLQVVSKPRLGQQTFAIKGLDEGIRAKVCSG